MDRADVTLQVTRCPPDAPPSGVAPVRAVSLTGARVQGRDVMAEEPRPHRPALYADLTAMIDAAGGSPAASRGELAAATAAVLVEAGRARREGERFIGLADSVGIDTLAALWRDADPVSLAGSLWALYLLRQWCRSDGDEVTRLWRAGEPLAPADSVVAGVGEYADVDAVQRAADAVLSGVYQGDLDVALERAAAFFRVVAAGRRCLGSWAQYAPDGVDLAERNERAAGSLTLAARRWRGGTLP